MSAGSPSDVPSLIVGVVAPAGATSVPTLLQSLPEQSSAAFLIFQHGAGQERLTEEDLTVKSLTARALPDELELAADSVYLLPPQFTFGHSPLTDVQPTVEHFLSSLADHASDAAVAVILSNTLDDEFVEGIRAVKKRGGLVLVEQPETSAPTEVMELVDYVLGLDELADQLTEITHRVRSNRSSPRPALPIKSPELDEIIDTLRARSGYDFRQYKKPTLSRRIQRRMGLRNIPDIASYIRLLESDQEESLQLFRDMLIGVTSFFRDREAFEELRNRILAPLIASRSDRDPIRIWMPGCSTGEEAYSLSMLLHEEFAQQNRSYNAQIFATDIDEKAVARARCGRYNSAIVDVVPDKYLQSYFLRDDQGYRVKKVLRESVTFAIQNVISDPPFSKLDLICCRNLLIYLEASMQNQLLDLFHFSLNDNGHLFLGSSESIARHEALFRPVSKQSRIFRKKPLNGQSSAEHRSYSFNSSSSHLNTNGLPMDPHSTFFSAAEATRSALLSHLAPAAVLINSRYEILYFHGETAQYLYRLEGEPTNDLCAIAASGLKTKIRTAVQQARKSGRAGTARARHVRKMDGTRVVVSVSAFPARKTRDGEPLFVVSFSDEMESEAAPDGLDEKNTSLHSQLEYELLVTRQDLQSTIEQLEASNEELKASNEEIMSMNEELQSSNEELETSREELQSLNEELNTVNNQLEEKVQELEALNNDLSNLLASTDIATIFLDTQLRIRRFTPATNKIVRLIGSDIGRPLADLALNFSDHDLIDDCQQVLQTLRVNETQVSDDSGHVYLRRITLYRTSSNRVGGVVITFTDITDINTVISMLAARERQQALVARFGQEALIEDNLDALFDRVAQWGTEAIGVEFCKVLELKEDQLILRAGLGWREGLIGQAFQSTELSSQGGYTLASRKPVMVEDMRSETRFPAPALLAQHGVRSGLSVVIGPYHKPWGVLGVHSRSPRRFTSEDINFIQALANGLWSAIQRSHSLREITTKAEQLQMAMHLGQMGSWTWDLDSNTATWDDSTAEIFGLPMADGQHSIDAIFARIHPDDMEAVHADVSRLITEQQDFRREYRIIHGQSGQLRWLAGYGGMRQHGREERSVVYGLSYDITERKHYEVALKDREEWLRLALTASELITFWIDLETEELSLYNPSLGRYLESDPHSLADFLENVHRDDRAKLEQVWRDAMEQESSFVIEYRIFRNGEVRWFRNWGNYVAIQGRRRLAGITMDISHEKEHEARLKAAKRAADASNQAKSAFLANMSHEIRTPLTAILGYADLLHMSRNDQEQTESYLHKIKANGHNLLEIIDDVLDLSKVEADHIEVRQERFDVKQLLGDLLSLTHLRAKEKELDFTIDIPEPIPAFIISDMGRIKQILSNLISNAIKFTHQGEVRLAVSADSSAGSDKITMVFRVIDTGIGIENRLLDKIFDPFEQADSSIAKLYGGTGLGLTISRRIAQLLNGQLAVESQPGKGSVFTLRLPVSTTEGEDYISFDAGELLTQASLPPMVDNRELAGVHVLVVDDVDDVLALIQQMLKMASATVSTARNGEEALEQIEIFETEGPGVDIVLMDTMMPVVDGYTAVRSLRQKGFTKPIVALTAAAMTNDRERCLNAGCNDYLSKPVTMEQLISVLKSQLPEAALKLAARKCDGNNKVLIVEDNPDAGEAVAALLEMLGYECRLSTRAKSALEIVKDFKPAVVLLDLTLPDMDGRELVGILRRKCSALLIALSGHDLPAQEKELKAAGFDCYLQKPVDMESLINYFPELVEPE